MGKVVEDLALRGRTRVFSDRTDAGLALAKSLRTVIDGDAVVLAIPSGGIPVATSVSREFGWPLGLMIVRKLQIPFEPEAGFGAVTLAGQMVLNRELVRELGLTAGDISIAREKALEEGRRRERTLSKGLQPIPLKGRTVVLIDDGLASGYTMLAAIREARESGAERIVVAVPTGSEGAVRMISEEADLLICLNLRMGAFAVADAYRRWHDLTEEEAVEALHSIA